MSANRVSRCPRCAKRGAQEHERLMNVAREAYGKVPPGEYMTMTEHATRALLPEGEATFAEYFEAYQENGKVTFDYGAGCGVCGLEFAVETSWDINIGPDDPVPPSEGNPE